MQKKIKKNIIESAVLVVISAVYTVLVGVIDVQPIGPENTNVGFAGINGYMNDLTGFNQMWYTITDILGYVTEMTAVVFALYGFVQLIKRKSLAKVDKSLYVLAGFYAVVGSTYLIFEKLALNYRPVTFDKGLEASYPSSHTVLAICFLAATITQSKRIIESKSIQSLINIACRVLMAVIVVGRILAGVHWFTDIVGGVIISCTLIAIYLTVLQAVELKNDKNI